MREMELITAAAAVDDRRGPRPARAGDGPKHADLHTECLNCGETLHGRFCARCGQTADDHHRSILHLAWEAVEGFTHLDGRLAQTLPALFLRPGRLARDHFEGRRQRHVPPFRLFLISLLLFMLALEFLVHRGAPDVARLQVDAAAPTAPGLHVRVTPGPPPAAQPGIAPATSEAATPPPATPPGFAEVKPPAPPQIDPAYAAAAPPPAAGAESAATPADSIAALEESGAAKSGLPAWLLKRAKAAGVSPEYFTTVMFEWAHRLAVLLLPIFAGLLTLCYCYKRKFYIYDHLIVSMQFLSFIFLVSAIAWSLPSPLRGVAIAVATLWTPVNLFMILRGAYGSSLVGAIVKATALWLSALLLFLLLLIGIVVVALGQMH